MKVVVIGAGIVGVTAALTLAEAGVEVIVLERGQVAGEASGLNAGVIGGGGWGTSPDVHVALRMGSRERYVDLSENRGREIGLDLSGTLTLIRTEREWAWAQARVRADQQAGHVHELIGTKALLDLEPAADPELLGAIFDPLSARAEPVAAAQAFATEATLAGATIMTGCAVIGLRPVTGGGWEVETLGSNEGGSSAGTLGADAVIIAAGPWCADIGAMVGIDVPIVPVRGQMWATAPQEPMLRHAIASTESASAWILDQPAGVQPPNLTHIDGQRTTRHLYGRQRPNGEIVFGGDRVLTQDRTVDAEGIAVNHAHVAELLPAVAALAPVRTWAGLMPFSMDGRPIIGPVAGFNGLIMAGGLASGGFGRGPMTGQLAAEYTLGHEPHFDMTSVVPDGRLALRPTTRRPSRVLANSAPFSRPGGFGSGHLARF